MVKVIPRTLPCITWTRKKYAIGEQSPQLGGEPSPSNKPHTDIFYYCIGMNGDTLPHV